MDKLSNGLTKRLFQSLHNSSGATLVYILAAFLIVSFLGITMIKASHHEVKSSSDYSAMMTASQAARSGLMATKQFIEKDPNSTNVLALLNAYIQDSNHNPRWILGDDATKISIDGQMSYKSKMLNFAYDLNEDDFRITVQSFGYGRGNSFKTITSVLELKGIGWGENDKEIPTQALHLSGSIGEVNGLIDVHGDMFVADSGQFNTGSAATTSNIYGILKTGAGAHSFNFENITFHKSVYFKNKTRGEDAPIIFKNGVAFEKQYWTTCSPGATLQNGNIFMNGGCYIDGSQKIAIGSNRGRISGTSSTYTSSGGSGVNIFSNPAKITLQSDLIPNIWDSLPDNVFQEDPPEIPINLTQVKTKAININFGYNTSCPPWFSGDGITGSNLQAMYDHFNTPANNNQLFGGEDGFLVLNIQGGNSTEKIASTHTTAETFNGKVIFIFEETSLRVSDGKWYNHGPNALTFIYIGSNKAAYTINCDYFRGFIYNGSSNTNNWEACVFDSNGGTIIGGVYVKNSPFRIENSSSTAITFKYNKDIVKAFAMIGLFDKTIVLTDVLELMDTNITTTELALQY